MSAPSAAIRLNANAEAWVGPRKSTPQQQQTPQSSSTQNGGRPPSPFPSFPDTASLHHATPHRSSLNTSLSAVPVCRYFLSGGCDKGTACPYRHELSVEAPIGGGHVVFENNVANLLRGEDGVQTPPPQQKRMNGSPSPPPPPGYFSGPSPQDAATRSSSDKHIFISRHYHYQPAVPTHHQGDFHNPPPPHPMSAYQSPQHVPRMPSPPFGPAVPPAAVNTPPYSRTYARPGEVPLGYTARGFSSATLPPPLHNAPPPPTPHHHQGLIFDGVRAAVLRKAHAAASSAERAHFLYENAHATTARAPGAWHRPSPPLAGMPAPPPNERLPVTSGGALLFDGTRDGASVHNVAHRGTAAESQGHPNFARSGGASAPTRSKLQNSMSIRSVTVAVEADSVSLGPSSTSTVGVPPVASDSFDLPPPLSAPVIPAPTSTDEDDDDRHSTTSADDLQRLQQLRAMLEHLA